MRDIRELKTAVVDFFAVFGICSHRIASVLFSSLSASRPQRCIGRRWKWEEWN